MSKFFTSSTKIASKGADQLSTMLRSSIDSHHGTIWYNHKYKWWPILKAGCAGI
ncbi:hypothetical protein LguiA_022486 [Lonicera macranthoides]